MEFLTGMSDAAVAIRLILATVLGSIIGWERIVRRHSAGIKTFALVSLGAAMASALNLYLVKNGGFQADAARIPAQVVSGIGFLGAGTILVTGRNQIKGLTTAASLWVTSCMGMAIGAGYLVAGLVCFGLIMFANLFLVYLNQLVGERTRYLSLYIELEEESGVRNLRKLLLEYGVQINSITKTKEKTLRSHDAAIIIDIHLGKEHSHQEVLEAISNLASVEYVEEV
ncbi:putative Mg2+ transporter-C (MgtC) family protein [Lachnospiraceae bacterium XBB1006]|nr:putative Mg2+ transporter-C (MgtC) family protein [Lachnospiraceae bacterium XBB1006]